MSRVGTEVSASLVHMLGRIYLPGYAYSRFYRHDLWFPRPATGKAYPEITCPTCHRSMVCVVRDVRGTIRIRVGYGLVALIRAVLYAISYTGVGIRGAVPLVPKRHEIGG